MVVGKTPAYEPSVLGARREPRHQSASDLFSFNIIAKVSAGSENLGLDNVNTTAAGGEGGNDLPPARLVFPLI